MYLSTYSSNVYQLESSHSCPTYLHLVDIAKINQAYNRSDETKTLSSLQVHTTLSWFPETFIRLINRWIHTRTPDLLSRAWRWPLRTTTKNDAANIIDVYLLNCFIFTIMSKSIWSKDYHVLNPDGNHVAPYPGSQS